MTRDEKVNVFEDYCRNVEGCDACTLEALGYCKIDNLKWTDAMVDIVYNRITAADKLDEAHERFMNIGDAVHSPSHYTKGGIECIDAIKASMASDGFCDYCKGNIIKYLWRWRDKGGVQDIEKAKVYLDWLIEAAKGAKMSILRCAKCGAIIYAWEDTYKTADGKYVCRECYDAEMEDDDA